MLISSKSELALRFGRPRVRWMSLMFARAAAMVALAVAVVVCWDLNVPWAIGAFMLCVLLILFIEAVACDRRRADPDSTVDIVDGHPVLRRRRETDP